MRHAANLNRPQPCDAVGGFHVQSGHYRFRYLRSRSRNDVLAADGIRRKIRGSCFYRHAVNSRNARQSALERTSGSRSPGTILIRNAATAEPPRWIHRTAAFPPRRCLAAQKKARGGDPEGDRSQWCADRAAASIGRQDRPHPTLSLRPFWRAGDGVALPMNGSAAVSIVRDSMGSRHNFRRCRTLLSCTAPGSCNSRTWHRPGRYCRPGRLHTMDKNTLIALC